MKRQLSHLHATTILLTTVLACCLICFFETTAVYSAPSVQYKPTAYSIETVLNITQPFRLEVANTLSNNNNGDSLLTLFVSSQYLIYQYRNGQQQLDVVAGGGTQYNNWEGLNATQAAINYLRQMKYYNNELYISAENSIFKIDNLGKLKYIAGAYEINGKKEAPDFQTYILNAIHFEVDKNREFIYISTYGNIKQYSFKEKGLKSIIGYDINSNDYPGYFTIDSASNELIYSDRLRCVLVRYNTITGNSSIVAGIFDQCGTPTDGNYANETTILAGGHLEFSKKNGDLYFKDNDHLRKIDSQGIITTVIPYGITHFTLSPDGEQIYHTKFSFSSKKEVFVFSIVNGSSVLFGGNPAASAGYSGDGGHVSNATFSAITGLKMNDQGELFIIDTTNYRIRKVSPGGDGIITTAIGNGKCDFHSLNDYKRNLSDFSICETSAINFDKMGNFYFVGDGYVLTMIDFTTNTITPLAGGNGDTYPAYGSQLSGGYNLFDFNEGGELHIMSLQEYGDTGDIRKIDRNGTIDSVSLQTVVYPGPNNVFSQNSRQDFVLYRDEYYYVDSIYGRINKYSPTTKQVEFVFKNQTDQVGLKPSSLQISSKGVMFVCDNGNNMIRMITPFDQTITTIAGTVENGGSAEENEKNATRVQLLEPFDLKLTKDGSIYLSDSGNGKVRKLTPYCPDDGYILDESGTLCVPQCFNRSSLNACSKEQQGICISPNTCSCQSGYYGNECQFYDCFGVKSSEPQVCSGNGKCGLPDKCICADGYYGVNCEAFNCFGKLYNSSNVCSNLNGTCIAPNNCSCKSNSGYYGNECNEYDCFGVKSSQSNVCSSRGKCTSPNKCSCLTGFKGDQCEQLDQRVVVSTGSTISTNFSSVVVLLLAMVFILTTIAQY